jgi:hypothetical protein
MTNLKWNSLVGIASLALTVTLASSVFAQGAAAPDKGGVKVGYLSCNVASGWGIIFGSTRELECTYSPTSGEPERYKGSISKFGADIGYVRSAVIMWGVFAPSTTLGKGALAGHYAGPTAGVTLGVGLGANILIGGMHSSIALQPISIEGGTGLNVAAGLASITLDYVMPKHAHEQ